MSNFHQLTAEKLQPKVEICNRKQEVASTGVVIITRVAHNSPSP